KAYGNENLIPFRSRNFNADPSAVVRGSLADVDHDVVNCSAHHAHELRLRARRGLEMQTTERSNFYCQRMIVLHKLETEACTGKYSAVPSFREETAKIAVPFRHDLDD